ncbi:MAG: hypothetical protein IPJ69_13080 [Deltaproteobacteria bacterium]|nr:MAG: hypothetical protein IPJ69_13080 [Deltaproteobacteria bacterium]
MSSQLQSNVVSVAYQDLPGAFVSQLKSLQVDFGSESALSLYEWSRSHISSLYFGTAIEEDTDISGETNTLLGNIYVQIDPQRLNDPVYILGRVAVIAHETYHLQYSRQVLFHHQYRVINERNAFVVGQRIALQGLRAYLQIHPLHVSVGTLVDCLQHFRNGDVNVLNQFSPEERSVIQMIFDTSKDRKSIMATNFVLGFAEDTLELIPEIIIPREDVRSRYPHDLVDQYLDMTNSTHDLFSQRALLVVCRELGLTH